MKFEYCYTTQATADIEIEDIGTFALCATTMFEEYYLIVQTTYGITKVIQYGPKQIDLNELPPRVFYSYNKFDYSQQKICKIIDDFINNEKRDIIQVNLLDIEECKSKIKNLVDELND